MPGCYNSCECDGYTALINKPTGPVSDCSVAWWVQPLVDNTILHLSELETGEGYQITSPPEQRRVVLKVIFISYARCKNKSIKRKTKTIVAVFRKPVLKVVLCDYMNDIFCKFSARRAYCEIIIIVIIYAIWFDL